MSEFNNPRLRVSLIAHDQEGRVLLLEHTRPHGSYWVLPGGGVEHGETLEYAIIREIHEELGIGCTLSRLAFVGELIQPERHVVDFFFSGNLKTDRPIRLVQNEGITGFRWASTGDPEINNLLPVEIRPKLDHGFHERLETVIYLGMYK